MKASRKLNGGRAVRLIEDGPAWLLDGWGLRALRQLRSWTPRQSGSGGNERKAVDRIDTNKRPQAAGRYENDVTAGADGSFQPAVQLARVVRCNVLGKGERQLRESDDDFHRCEPQICTGHDRDDHGSGEHVPAARRQARGRHVHYGFFKFLK